MSYVCEYCNSNFARAYNLKQHKLKAQYCIALRKKKQQQCICEHCGKEISRKDNLKRHMDICQKAIERSNADKLACDVEELKQIVSRLKVDTNHTNVNRNFVANLQPVVEEDIEAIALEYLTIDDLKKGVDGLVTFVLNYPLGKNIVCTDKSRKKIQYKNADGHVVNDTGGIKLAHTFFKAINPRNQELIRNEYDEIHAKVQDIISREAAHDENVAELMMEAMKIQTLAAKCEEIAQGGDNEVRTDFVNRLTKQL